jgi:hypothetical protein
LLSSSFWKRAAEKYKRIECILPIDQAEPNDQPKAPENYFPLCYFAATHHISINTAYLARVDENKFKTMRTNLLQLIEHGQLDSQALYVFQNSALWGSGVLRMTKGDWAGVVDGFKIIAPSWDGERRQDTLSALRKAIPEYHFGAQPLFVAGAEGTRYLGYGWSQPETWGDRSGVWSDGDSASIILLLDREPTSDAFLQLDGVGFVSAKCPRQEIDISVNSTTIGELTYSRENAKGLRSIRVPRELLVGHHGLVVIRFRFKNEVSPAHLGLSADSRDLALWLKAFALRPSENSLVPKPNSGLADGGSE